MSDPVVLWHTGRPCAGKSTIANLVAESLRGRGCAVHVLDGDELRRALSADLGYSLDERCEHARRVAHVAASVIDVGGIAIVALVSPVRRVRAEARAVLGRAFVEIYVDAPLSVCEARDVKGLYAQARRGLIADFTGVSSPFEPPDAPALRLDTTIERPTDSAQRVIAMLAARRRGAAVEAPTRSAQAG